MADIGVIGSGVAGLAAAARLRAKGHQVTVFEANAYPGGKLHHFESEGFRFDAGPSLFTMPDFPDEVFRAAGKDPRQYYTYREADPACNYFWEDGTQFRAPAGATAFASEASKVFGIEEEKIRDYLQERFDLYDLTEDVFLKNSLHKLSNYLRLSTLRSLMKLSKAKLFSTMNEVNEANLSHPMLIQLFNRYATYNGSDPYRAPGTLTLIPTLEIRGGCFFPDGGMHSITRSLHRLNEDIGVKFRFSEKVKKINVETNQVIGLSTDLGNYKFDKVVSNMDVVLTYRNLLKDVAPPRRIEKQERSTSALVFYWGVKGEFPELGLHNIFWSKAYRQEFKALFEDKTISDDPTVYIHISSKMEPGDSPPGCENWFVMVNAPVESGQDWEALRNETREKVLKKLERNLGRSIRTLIRTERYTDPPKIALQSSGYLGSLYGTSSNDRLSAFLRHPNFTGKVRDLYFCGGSVHPGGGIPLCLLSAKIVTDLIS